jgi:uncharacterized membrane-anchored protein YhcB (DUF1043 family)
MEKLKKFSKWLLLLPITIVGFLIYRLLKSKPFDQKAAESMIEAVKKDRDILAEQKKNVEKSTEAKQKAEEIGKEIEKINKEEGDLEWHLKIKK